jgi:pre-rRNA-processing protein IPI3
MLSEHIVTSIGAPFKATGTSIAKDAAVFVHEYQPSGVQQAMFKKSATPQNCLAVSSTHIFAAQTGKAVVHVYNREKGNHEATIPFTERINCLTLACDDAVLILGTAEGRIFLWEVATGRQVTTAQSHLQPVNQLTVDAASNFLISASADSTCQFPRCSLSQTMDHSRLHLYEPSRTTELRSKHSPWDTAILSRTLPSLRLKTSTVAYGTTTPMPC